MLVDTVLVDPEAFVFQGFGHPDGVTDGERDVPREPQDSLRARLSPCSSFGRARPGRWPPDVT